jgi:hypothetical protein
MIKFFSTAIFIFILAAFCGAQTTNSITKKPKLPQAVSTTKSTPTFAEILLRRTERESELEEFLLDYTGEFPKVNEIRCELSLLQK